MKRGTQPIHPDLTRVVVTYAGGNRPWQSIDRVAFLFARMKEINPKLMFFGMTKEDDALKKAFLAHGVSGPDLMIEYVPYDQVLYLDADTLVHGDMTYGFDLLDDGWDMAITHSSNQDREAFWHVEDEERHSMEAQGIDMLQLQGGVFFVARNERTVELFRVWHEEWSRWRGKDQAALVHALVRVPVRLWLLGRPWKGGSVVAHRFGELARP